MNQQAVALTRYIQSLTDFEIQQTYDTYNHMGAVVVDGILQASLNYEHVVKPRILKIIAEYPEAVTTSDFIAICDSQGIKNIINWKDDRKPNYILGLLSYLQSNSIETVAQLRKWLSDNDHKDDFINQNKGIGAVTAEYFRILTGDESVKIDRHLREFMRKAGITVQSDNESIEIITEAAHQMDTKPSVLDYSIWSYQAKK